MKIKEIRAMRGPNYWSIKRCKLIVMVLDLEEMEAFPSNEIEGFNNRLKTLLPGLSEHYCSVGRPGGFFERLETGTWMGHVVEHIALELQVMAGMETNFGKTRDYGEPGVYHVVFEYVDEEAGRYAARAAVNLCEAVINDKEYDVQEDVEQLKTLRQEGAFGPSTQAIIRAAENRDIPWIRLNEGSYCQLGYGIKQQKIQATITGKTSNLAVDLACNKEATKRILKQAGVKVPNGESITELEELEDTCKRIEFPLVIKPIDGNHGRGITSNISDFETAVMAFNKAKEVSDRIIVESHVKGSDYRLLVVNHKMIAASKRTPAHVIGDGVSTVKELVEITNCDPKRGNYHENVLTRIELDEHSIQLLQSQGYTPESVLDKDEILILKDTANLSTGGTAEDVTDRVHPETIALAERVARVIGLDICGIDLISPDISKPIDENGGRIIEVNAGPGFRMHLSPTDGLPRNVAAAVVDGLFPKGENGRIPIVAVTGTNGKTTTTRLLAHIAKKAGKKVGYTTTDGVYIFDSLIMKGDCTGPVSTELVLKDPGVDFAVLECARGGLLRAGLAFDQCDIGIVTNVEGDHLGLDGIHTQDQLARLKSVIPETVKQDGHAILNADDDRVYAMRRRLDCKIALFSMNENNPRILSHINRGGIAAVFENGYITLLDGAFKTRIIKAEDIPISFRGKAEFMIQNAIAAVLGSHLSGFGLEPIREGLKSFMPSIEQTPGRLNIFRFENFCFMLDYAHNPTGMRALKKFTDSLDFSHKVGIIAGIGDRLDSDTEEIGRLAAQMFDEVIIREDRDLRGKTSEHLSGLIRAGINSVDPTKLVTLAGSEPESIKYAVQNARKDSLIVLCSDAVSDSLMLLKNLQEMEKRGELDLQNFSAINN